MRERKEPMKKNNNNEELLFKTTFTRKSGSMEVKYIKMRAG